MEDVQSWWEVPAIAHFCSVFRAAFNLIYFDVSELELAILNLHDPELSISLDNLIIKLLQGCFEEDDVTYANWEEKLKEILDENSDEEEDTTHDVSFQALSPRSKVEVLFKLCHIRMDIAATEDLIKDIPAESMQGKCIGQDSEKYSYWYFGDERLYKESPDAGKKGKQVLVTKNKNKETAPSKSRRQGIRDKKPAAVSQKSELWSIVCFNLNDWEKLAQKLSKSKSTSEKELSKTIKTKYLEDIAAIVNEKEKLLRKRLLELAPKRTSSRISKVQAQKKLEEQMAAEAMEQKRIESEKEAARKEQQKKIQVVEDRQKRAEERSKIIEERARRAQQRGMLKGFVGDYEDSNSSDDFSKTRYNTRTKNQKQNNSVNDSENEDSDEEEERPESEVEDDESDSNESENDNEESESDSNNYEESGDKLQLQNGISRSYIQQDIIHSYDLTEWNSTIDTNGRKLHVLQTASSDEKEKKRLRINEAGHYKVSSLNGLHSATQKENNNSQSFQLSNRTTYCNSAPQRIVKVDIWKQAANQGTG